MDDLKIKKFIKNAKTSGYKLNQIRKSLLDSGVDQVKIDSFLSNGHKHKFPFSLKTFFSVLGVIILAFAIGSEIFIFNFFISGETNFDKGRVYLESGSLDRAEKFFLKASVEGSESERLLAYRGLASVYFEKEDYLKAQENLKKILATDEYDFEILLMLGQTYYLQNDFDNARVYVWRAMVIKPGNELAINLTAAIN